ncbi:hypothetical protein B0H14DRAFT_2612388 [Mycena olivaceomarginata]|nr:hypothetical protein B0H14DRAFT_2612388 [Mycena olivaceomarginata]
MQDGGTFLESRFIVTEKRVPLEGGGELVYDFVEPCGGRLSLHHQLQLTRDYNFLHRPDDFNNLITYLRPVPMRRVREEILLDWVYAVCDFANEKPKNKKIAEALPFSFQVLAVLHRSPKKSQRFAYLEHQEDYLNGETFAEWSALSKAKIDTCFETGIHLDVVLVQAQEANTEANEHFFWVYNAGCDQPQPHFGTPKSRTERWLLVVHGYPGAHRNLTGLVIVGLQSAAIGIRRIYAPLDSNGHSP